MHCKFQVKKFRGAYAIIPSQGKSTDGESSGKSILPDWVAGLFFRRRKLRENRMLLQIY